MMEITNSDASTASGVVYRLRVRVDDDRVRVWRNAQGEAPALIFDEGGLTMVDTERSKIATIQGADFRFDNFAYHFWSNLDEFLKLSDNTPVSSNPFGPNGLIEGAVILDENGDPIENEPTNIAFRDFDDQLAPLDGDSSTPEEILRDIGADEFSTPIDSSFWWRRF